MVVMGGIIGSDIFINPFLPYRLERVNGTDPVKRLKGYPTPKHRDAVISLGFSPYHRKTFRVSDPQLELFTGE